MLINLIGRCIKIVHRNIKITISEHTHLKSNKIKHKIITILNISTIERKLRNIINDNK